ncbi:MAG: hypothetical protein IPQ13_08225 [Holophagaceae bacterium]|nr:hypothetical protein [Holophagaceae bacterium]
MEIPEELRGLVDELGEALVSAMVLDDRCRDLTTRIQAAGFDLSLSLEAMVTRHSTEDHEDGHRPLAPEFTAGFSPEDKALLRNLRITLD